MDSLEGYKSSSKGALSEATILSLLEQFGARLEKEGIDRLSVGCGGETPDFLKKNLASFPEQMQEGTQYGDSLNQAIIRESSQLKEARRKLHPKFHKDIRVFASVQQAKLFGSLAKEQVDKLNKLTTDEFVIFVSLSYGYTDLEKLTAAFEKLFSIKRFDPGRYLALTSENAQRVYQTGKVVISDIADLDIVLRPAEFNI